jgi:hypothetical protein
MNLFRLALTGPNYDYKTNPLNIAAHESRAQSRRMSVRCSGERGFQVGTNWCQSCNQRGRNSRSFHQDYLVVTKARAVAQRKFCGS